jgi:hypothetical protein
MFSLTSGVSLGAALWLVLAAPATAQSAASAAQPLASARDGSEAAQAQTQAQPPPATGAATQEQPERAAPPLERQRPSERTPRTSRRERSLSPRGSFEEGRAPRGSGPTQQELTLLANLLGGYDDNVTGGLGTGPGVAPTAMASGGTAFLDGTLSYRLWNNRHSITIDSTGNLTAYPGYLDDPAPGAVVYVAAETTAGRDTRFRFSERVGYEALFSVYSQGSSSTPLPPEIGSAAPVTGLFEYRSWNSNSSASVQHRWGQRDWTSLSYFYRRQEFTDDEYGDNRSHEVEAGYRRGFSRGVRVLLQYRYRNLEYADAADSMLPTREHRIEAGPEIEKVLSRRRQLTFSLTAGAAHFESLNSTTRLPYEDWVPTGSVNLNYRFSPSWNVEGGYRRDLSTFQGVTDEVYNTDTISLGSGGRVGGRTDVRVGVTYGGWRTQFGSGLNDMMNVYGASVGFDLSLTATVSATARYNYYYHRYSNPGSLPEGFPAEYDRHAVRVGLTLQLPIAESPAPPGPTQR